MFFFIRERETLLGDVSTDVVKSESRVDSRYLHCRTSSKDSTSETARERKDRAQTERERSPVMTFSRKLSFIMRMRALMDGHWRGYVIAGFLWKAKDSFHQLSLETLELGLGQQAVVENPRLSSVEKTW